MSIAEDELRRCLDVLELDEDATLDDVSASYRHLRGLYGGGGAPAGAGMNIVTMPFEQDFTPESRRKILGDVESAYKTLMEYFSSPRPKNTPSPAQGESAASDAPEEFAPYTGSSLKRRREQLKMDIYDIADKTRIKRSYLTFIEECNYKSLPQDVFLKGYLKIYAQKLRLPVERVIADYFMEREGSSGAGNA